MTTTTAFIVLCGALLVNGAFLKRPQLDGRIMGGTNADIVNHPYQVALRSKGNNYQLCGATIISKDWVLTSARCVVYELIDSILFRAGSSNRNKGGFLHEAEEVIVHENYNSGSYDYDYALVKVYPPFSFGPGVQAIGLADTEPATGETGVITGWGLDDPFQGSFQDLLQVANVRISERGWCIGITPRMICTRTAENSRDICWGDNGGPLVVGGKLAGIASFDACGEPNYTSLYANIANQRAWIKTKTGI